MPISTVAQIENILNDIIYDRYDDLPDNLTRAMNVAIKRKFPSYTVEADLSYTQEGLWVASVKADIDGIKYFVNMCYDAGSTLCYIAE